MLLGAVRDARFDAFAAQRQQQPLVAELALSPGDPLVVRELLQVHFGPVGEGVRGRHGDVGGVVEERCFDQAVRDRQRLVVPVEDDRHVDVTAHHRRHRGRRFHFVAADPQPRVRQQRGEPRRAAGRAWPWGTPRSAARRPPCRAAPPGRPGRVRPARESARRVRRAAARVGERTPRPFLASSCWPTSRSSFAICWDTAEVVTCRPAAAPPTEPCRARASSVRRRSRFSMGTLPGRRGVGAKRRGNSRARHVSACKRPGPASRPHWKQPPTCKAVPHM